MATDDDGYDNAKVAAGALLAILADTEGVAVDPARDAGEAVLEVRFDYLPHRYRITVERVDDV